MRARTIVVHSTFLSIVLAMLSGPGPYAQEATPWAVLELEDPEDRAALRDVDGDGDEDLVLIQGHALSLRRMDDQGRYPDDDDLVLPWPSEQVAWNLADLDGDGAHEIVLFLDGKRVVRYVAGEAGIREGQTVLETRGQMPRGIFHMNFCRDVDGDGRLDLVLPTFGAYAIFLQGDQGFGKPLRVSMQVDVDTSFGDPRSLGRELGQDVDIPWFTLEDLDGDGLRDLRAETDEQVFFHLASPELSDQPTWVLNLEKLRQELPPGKGVDLDDLLRMAGRQVGWRLAALSPDRPKDLIVRVGSKFRIYHGGSRVGPQGVPDQLLKSSGNVLFFFVRDATGDGHEDLQLLRGEGLSLGRVIRWLLLPGSLDFQLYTYTNEKGEFSTQPTRRNTISLKIPRILAFIDKLEKLEEEKKDEEAVLASLIALDADGRLDDIVDCRDGKLFFYRSEEIPAELLRMAEMEDGDELTDIVGYLLLDDLDQRGDGATRSIDLDEIEEWDISLGVKLREASSKLEPVRIVPLEVDVRLSSLHVRDLNGDGRSDVVLIGKRKEGARYVQFLVR